MAIDFNKFGKSSVASQPVKTPSFSTSTPSPQPVQSTAKSGVDFNKFGKSSGQPVPVATVEKKDGFVKGLVKAPITTIARPFQAAAVGAASLFGGEGAADRTANRLDDFSQNRLGGFVAPIPRAAGDVKQDFGRAAQTVAFGAPGVASGGALFGAGSSLEGGNDLFSVDTAFQTALGGVGGKVLGLVGKPLMDVTGKVVGKITPQVLKDVASRGSAAISEFAKTHNILPGTVGKTVSPVTSTLGKTTENILNRADSAISKPFDIAKKAMQKTESQTEKKIGELYSKAVRPSSAGKTSQGQADRYDKKAIDAIKTINENKAGLTFSDDIEGVISGKSPQTLQQLSESVSQTKRNIFKQYNQMAKEAGDIGLQIRTDNVIKELDDFIGNKAVEATNPAAIRYARQVKNWYQNNPNLAPEIVEDIIASNNVKLKNFMSGKATDQSSSVAVDSLLTNILRRNLDDGISGLTSPGYAALKKQYGNLSAIEKDVVKASLKELNQKNSGGLNMLLDASSGAQLAYGIVNANPGALASAATTGVIKNIHKILTDPNRMVKNMFKNVDKLPSKGQNLFTKGPTLALPGRGQSSFDDSKPMFATPKGKISSFLQEASDVAAVETKAAKQPKAGPSKRVKLKEMLEGNEPYIAPKDLPVIQGGSKLKSGEAKRLRDIYGDLPTIQGKVPIKPLAAGAALTAGAVAGAPKLKSMFKGTPEASAEAANTQVQPVAKNNPKPVGPKVVKTQKMPGGRTVHTLESGNQVVDLHPNIQKEIEKTYKKHPNIDRGVLEALVMKESSGGYDDTNRNPNIGKYAWIGGVAGKGGARDEFKRLGIDVDLNTIEGTLDAMAKYWTIIQKRKGIKDPVALYDDGYSSGKLKKDDIDKFADFVSYYKSK